MVPFRKLPAILLFVLLSIRVSCQTSAQDWTKSNCDGNNVHLFDLLDNGIVVILDFVHVGCVPCIIGTTYLHQIALDYEISHPGKVKLFCLSYDDIATCNDMNGWGNANGFPEMKFINNSSDVAYYGGMGMPTVVVLGGAGHQVFFKKLGMNSSDDPVVRSAVDQALLAPVGLPAFSESSIKIFQANGALRIEGLNPEKKNTISLLTLSGKEILRSGERNADSYLLETPGIANGLYLIKIQNPDQVLYTKIMILQE